MYFTNLILISIIFFHIFDTSRSMWGFQRLLSLIQRLHIDSHQGLTINRLQDLTRRKLHLRIHRNRGSGCGRWQAHLFTSEQLFVESLNNVIKFSVSVTRKRKKFCRWQKGKGDYNMMWFHLLWKRAQIVKEQRSIRWLKSSHLQPKTISVL